METHLLWKNLEMFDDFTSTTAPIKSSKSSELQRNNFVGNYNKISYFNI